MNIAVTTKTTNGIDTEAMRQTIKAIMQDPSKAMTHWQAATHWISGTRSESHVTSCTIGDKWITKDFRIRVDEPFELCGTNLHPNSQEILIAALNSCMIVGYAALCAQEGIELESLRIETEGDIDLRGFFGIDSSVKPGYGQLRYVVHIKGNASPEQFEKIHCAVMATSPNYYNLHSPVPLQSRLIVG